MNSIKMPTRGCGQKPQHTVNVLIPIVIKP